MTVAKKDMVTRMQVEREKRQGSKTELARKADIGLDISHIQF